MGITIGIILLLLFISWMNTNDCWAFGLTMFFICFVLMFVGVWQGEQEKNSNKQPADTVFMIYILIVEVSPYCADTN